MTCETQALLSELDNTLSGVPRSRHLQMLQQVTTLFLAHAGSYSEEQVAVFDAVIKRLARDVSSRELVGLSSQLAVMESAPADTVSQLSASDDIAVSGPVLEKSKVLKDNDLVGIAKTKGQNHLLAIAGREHINDVVSDVLVERGDAAVKRKLIRNEGAQISESGFARLVSEASRDKALAAIVATRDDVPPELMPFLEVALG